MALDTVITGSNLDTNGNLKATGPQDKTQAGYTVTTTRLHDGSTGYNQAIDRPLEVSINKRLRVGVDNLWFQDRFSYAAQWTAVWKSTLTTFTATHVGGFLVLNGGNVTTAAAVANYETYKEFRNSYHDWCDHIPDRIRRSLGIG